MSAEAAHSRSAAQQQVSAQTLTTVLQHEGITGHRPGQLRPILDHSRVLETEGIPLHSFYGLPQAMLFSMAQTPRQNYYTGVAGQQASEGYGKSQSGFQHLVCVQDVESPTFSHSREMTRSGLLPCSQPNLKPLSSFQNILSHTSTPRRLHTGSVL